MNSFVLLVPGALTSLLIFLLSSNKLLPHQENTTVFILNLLQIQMLGITIAKYGADQVILAKLTTNNRTSITQLFLKRVLPLALIFSIVVAYIKGNIYFVYFLALLPMEVFSVITAIELSVSRKFFKASFVTLLGYPLTLITLFFVGYSKILSNNAVFTVFFIGSALKFIICLILRNRGKEEDILIMSYLLPLQQVGNFLMFRFDQLIIASGLFGFLFVNHLSVNNYLFLAKFPEVTSGIIVALAPIVYKKLGDKKMFSIKTVFSSRLLLIIAGLTFVTQIAIYALFLHPENFLSLFIYLPFTLITILILPANLVTYVLLKRSDIRRINYFNIVSCVIGVVIVTVALLLKNVLVFCYAVPAILFSYIFLFSRWHKQ